jgi:hypothetical protein
LIASGGQIPQRVPLVTPTVFAARRQRQQTLARWKKEQTNRSTIREAATNTKG